MYIKVHSETTRRKSIQHSRLHAWLLGGESKLVGNAAKGLTKVTGNLEKSGSKLQDAFILGKRFGLGDIPGDAVGFIVKRR